MFQPKSLTATVHIKFHYQDPEGKPVSESQVEMMNRILTNAADLDPALQELLVNFVDHLSEVCSKDREGRAEPQ